MGCDEGISAMTNAEVVSLYEANGNISNTVFDEEEGACRFAIPRCEVQSACDQKKSGT